MYQPAETVVDCTICEGEFVSQHDGRDEHLHEPCDYCEDLMSMVGISSLDELTGPDFGIIALEVRDLKRKIAQLEMQLDHPDTP